MDRTIAIIGVILSVVSIIVGVLLVKEGREFLKSKLQFLRKTMMNIWASFIVQVLVVLIIGLGLLILFIRLNYLSMTSALPMAAILLIIFGMLVSLNNSTRKLVAKTNLDLIKISSTVNRLTEIEKVELKAIKGKWSFFLEQVSLDASLIAIHNLLIMSEPFAVNNHDIIVLVPDILEPTIRNLSDGFKDLEPMLKNVFDKPYKLVVHTSQNI